MRSSLIRKFPVRFFAVSAMLAGAGLAYGDVSNVVFTITATNSGGTASYAATIDQGTWLDPETYRWSGGGIDLIDSEGDHIATLNTATFFAVQDPVVTLIFDVQAGAADTSFFIQSGLVSFPTIPSGVATGSATAGLTLTDAGQDSGAGLVGTGGSLGGMSYQANYNGLAPAGTLFAEFIPGLNVATAGGSTTGSGSTGGFVPIAGPVSSISSAFDFTLSALDSASGTSAFIVVPEPASLLLVLGGLLVARRRG
ncbi:MAG: hypothetical protein HZB38_09240 [Planctomycetes bacterium]|nr:hypothetical protein [Planctomycetota bacterium]